MFKVCKFKLFSCKDLGPDGGTGPAILLGLYITTAAVAQEGRRKEHCTTANEDRRLSYGGITYLINSFDYPNLLCFNSPPTHYQFL